MDGTELFIVDYDLCVVQQLSDDLLDGVWALIKQYDNCVVAVVEYFVLEIIFRRASSLRKIPRNA